MDIGNQQWYVALGGQPAGPYGTDKLRSLAADGRIGPDTLVYGQGFNEWTPLKAVGELAGVFSPQAAPPPPPPSRALADEIDYVIEGTEMQYVEIELDPGESAVAEAGAMLYMNQDITMETIFGDGRRSQGEQSGGLLGSLMGAGKRLLTGESLFMTVFTHSGPTGKARVAFAAPYPGKILPMHLGELGGELICQKDAFLCAARGVALEIAFQKKIGVGLFGGEGFIMQRLVGDGLAFVHAGGTVVEMQLEAGQSLRVDTGCLVALSPSVKYDVQLAGGIKTAFFGGEGLFLANLTGPGHVWLQSLPFSRLAGRIWAAAPQGGGKQKGEGSILGGFLRDD
ncbi:MAG: TIGR00266 family protein [Desulfarculaceae bacterium]|nr:TIGR00266 family protein [Desulfarculaceae bacterium]MCF8048114.1 TIGR00266 family protein [Desulfarculaceae bacterium]MCF8099705.1 TIGR00266 family protein [Desulfarculaceae bacterium]MCF8123082.1 TIGR00266 family protein [Desulfarculaceae bacterium]